MGDKELWLIYHSRSVKHVFNLSTVKHWLSFTSLYLLCYNLQFLIQIQVIVNFSQHFNFFFGWTFNILKLMCINSMVYVYGVKVHLWRDEYELPRAENQSPINRFEGWARPKMWLWMKWSVEWRETIRAHYRGDPS